MANNTTLEEIAPFFIVKNLAVSIDFYNQKLGFETDLVVPEDDPFFGIVSRDSVRILLKHITDSIHPVPKPYSACVGKMGCFYLGFRS